MSSSRIVMYVGCDGSVKIDVDIDVDTADSDVALAVSFKIIHCLVYPVSPLERSESIIGCLR